MPLDRKKIKIVLDTNIYISALLFSGIPEEIIDLSREGKFLLITSSDILFEVARVLQNKFSFSKNEALYAVSEIRRIALVVAPQEKIEIITRDPSDNRILECAFEGKADYIITGDKKHLRTLGEYKNIKILLPGEFIKLL